MNTAVHHEAVGDVDNVWTLEVDGRKFRWCITAGDNGVQVHVQDFREGGTLLVVKGLTYSRSRGLSHWHRIRSEQARFSHLPDAKVASLIRQAVGRGWRPDMDQPIFWM